MASSRVRFTVEDLAQLPEDKRAELHEGDLVMVPSADGWHQALLMRVIDALRDHVGRGDRDRVLPAPLDVVFDHENVLQPDVVVLPEGARAKPKPWSMPTPVLVVEVLSPSTEKRDRGVKLRILARFGVREAWNVDPVERTVEVHRLGESRVDVHRVGEFLASAAVPGFRLDVAELFGP